MATIAYPGQLQNAQTGNADSTNTIQVKGEINLRPFLLRIVSTVGATPTVTIKILGSYDGGASFIKVPYSVMSAVAGDYSTADIVTTTAKTELYELMPFQGWSFLKINMSANTNVTLTSDLL